MSKPQILISGSIIWAQKELSTLSTSYDIFHLPSDTSRSEFIVACQAPEGVYRDVVAIYRHNISATTIGIYDEELVRALPKGLKWLAHNGAGYDQIDVGACTKRGIKVSNTPLAVDDATATVGMYLIISAFRQFYKAEQTARAGVFKTGTVPAHDPENKVLGIVGMGGIGRALAKRALGFDMKIQYYNRNPVDASLLSSFPPGSITYIPTLELLLSTSDCVSLNLPLNAQTEGFFGKAQFDQMKRGAILINTARGGVVDEESMLEALESGHLASVGLDVFPSEPTINPRLLANERLTLLPHMGTETEETQKKMELLTLENLISGIEEGRLLTPVWEQKGKL